MYGIYNKTFSKPLCLMYCFLSRCCYIDLVDILFVLSVYDIIVWRTTETYRKIIDHYSIHKYSPLLRDSPRKQRNREKVIFSLTNMFNLRRRYKNWTLETIIILSFRLVTRHTYFYFQSFQLKSKYACEQGSLSIGSILCIV